MTANHTTGPDGSVVTWVLQDDGVPRVWMIRFANDDTPAYVYPSTPIPAGTPGTVTFRDHKPSLVRCRVWFPEHEKLWDAVEDEHSRGVRDRLLNQNRTSCADARAFTPAEHDAWLRTL